MKRILTLALLVLILPILAWTPPRGIVTLEWDYPKSEATNGMDYYVYGSTNITTPFDRWVVMTNVIGTNGIIGISPTNTGLVVMRASVQIAPGAHWFAVTASNMWGQSDFSELVSTPPLPRRDQSVRIKRAE